MGEKIIEIFPLRFFLYLIPATLHPWLISRFNVNGVNTPPSRKATAMLPFRDENSPYYDYTTKKISWQPLDWSWNHSGRPRTKTPAQLADISPPRNRRFPQGNKWPGNIHPARDENAAGIWSTICILQQGTQQDQTAFVGSQWLVALLKAIRRR